MVGFFWSMGIRSENPAYLYRKYDNFPKGQGISGSANIGGGKLFHILSGNLSHQIEHHLFPDMCSNRYPEVAPRVRALATRYGLPYNTGSLTRQFGTTVWKILRLSLPGGAYLDARPVEGRAGA